jgi:Isochorismatase family
VRGEPGWEIIPELAPVDGESIIDEPGKGKLFAIDFELLLRLRGIANLVLTGITTNVCVHTRRCARLTIAASNVCCSKIATAPPTAPTTRLQSK